jgi:hypothetical protein
MNPRSFTVAAARQVLLLIGIVTGARAQSAQSAPSASCPGTWSTPVRVQRADGRPVYVEPGPIAPLGRATLAIGAPTFFWLGKDHLAAEQDMATDSAQVRWAVTRSGALIDSTGTAIALASIGSGQEWKHPGLLAWSNRRLDVAWSAGDSAQGTGTPNEATRIGIASFDGRRWTAPETILRGMHVRFIDPPAMGAGTPFDVGVVAATVRDSAGYAVRVTRKLVGNWATADWRGATFVHYASAVTTSDGSVVVVMMVTPKDGSAGVYSMRASRWPPSDSDWPAPQRIDSLRSQPAMFGAFAWARLGADSLVVVWSQSGGGASSLGLTTALSVDGAKSWRLMPPLIHASPIDDQRLAVDAQGRLHVVSSTTNIVGALKAPGSIVHAIWQSGTWTTPTAVSTEASVTAPGLGFAPGGRLMATWTEVVQTPQGPVPRTLASLWTPNCTTRR